MMFKWLRNVRWYLIIPIIIIFLINPLIYTRLINEYILHFVFSIMFFLSGVAISIFIKNQFLNFKWKKAPEKELRVEDTVLLEGMGLFQGTLFLYLSLLETIMTPTLYNVFFKWSIIIFTTLFFLIRGYGAIKNSKKHRYYSALILTYYMTLQISTLINIFISKRYSINIGSRNIISSYFPMSISFIIIYFYDSIKTALKTRYGLPRPKYEIT